VKRVFGRLATGAGLTAKKGPNDMRIIAYFIIGAAVAVLGIPAYAQTVLKNDTGGWTPVMDVVGPNDEPIGRVYSAPKSTVVLEHGKVTSGAGKFVANKGMQIGMTCSVFGDKIVDWVGLDVSSISWNAVGNPVSIELRRPVVTYHLAADKSDNLEEQKLLVDAKYPGYSIVYKSDSLALKEIAGNVKPSPTLVISFVVKADDKSVREDMGLFVGFDRCRVATPTPQLSTTPAPKTTPKPASH
jgi:hypothetical protein